VDITAMTSMRGILPWRTQDARSLPVYFVRLEVNLLVAIPVAACSLSAAVHGFTDLAEGYGALGVILLVTSAIGLSLALRFLTVGVIARRDAIVIRNALLTTRVPWGEIDHFEIGKKDPYNWPVGIAVRRNGRRVGMLAIQN